MRNRPLYALALALALAVTKGKRHLSTVENERHACLVDPMP